MKKIRFALIIAAFVLSISNVASQITEKSPNRVTGSTCQWVGTVETSFNFDGRYETISGTVRFEQDKQDKHSYPLIIGNMTYSVSGSTSSEDGSCTYSLDPTSFDIVPDSLYFDFGLLVIGDYGNYSILVSPGKLNDCSILYTSVCHWGGPNNNLYTSSYESCPTLNAISLEDSTRIGNDVIRGEQTIYYDDSDWTTIKWNLHKESAGENKLIVEAEGYDNWVPEATRSGVETDVGNVIKFKAKLTEEDGTTACATADSFKFELTKVSHEPGVCLNYPRTEVAGKDHDLHFKQGLNSPTDVMSPDRLSLHTKEGREADASVASFDWGSFGTLKVTAYLPGGKIITGYLKGHPEIKEIPIPKRTGDSKIADKWKQDHGVQGLADDDDSETDPEGDKNPGDGFTLYEEYRGFFEAGEHIIGDPKKKDLFVYPEVRYFYPGIQLFKALTGLNVHYQLRGSFLINEEFNKFVRLINFNHSDPTLHRVDQHGLWILPIPTSQNKGYSYVSRLGPPKNVDSVNISLDADFYTTIFRGIRQETRSYFNSTVAHELGHAVCIKHHGEIDEKKSWITQNFFNYNTAQFDYEFFEAGHPGQITLKWEDGTPFTESVDGTFYVARWEGQHSGFEDCIMRYDCAYAYIPEPASNIRYIVRWDERTGIKLCDTKVDSPDGVNFLSRQPRSRYGSATEGDCVHQICVNDKYH